LGILAYEETVMAALHLDNVPPELLERLEQRARLASQSLDVLVVTMLQRAVTKGSDQADLLAGLAHSARFCPEAVGAPDSTSLLREDRDR
jgi:hypothetical protein